MQLANQQLETPSSCFYCLLNGQLNCQDVVFPDTVLWCRGKWKARAFHSAICSPLFHPAQQSCVKTSIDSDLCISGILWLPYRLLSSHYIIICNALNLFQVRKFYICFMRELKNGDISECGCHYAVFGVKNDQQVSIENKIDDTAATEW